MLGFNNKCSSDVFKLNALSSNKKNIKTGTVDKENHTVNRNTGFIHIKPVTYKWNRKLQLQAPLAFPNDDQKEAMVLIKVWFPGQSRLRASIFWVPSILKSIQLRAGQPPSPGQKETCNHLHTCASKELCVYSAQVRFLLQDVGLWDFINGRDDLTWGRSWFTSWTLHV